MKKIYLLAMIIFFMFVISGCNSAGTATDIGGISEEDITVIGERFFVMQIQDVFLNPNNYIGSAIRYEGMFFSEFWPPTGETFYMVVRFADDCCGGGGIIGFEVYLGDIQPFPDDTWVEVTGIVELYNDGYGEFLRLVAVSVIEMDERGMEVVPF